MQAQALLTSGAPAAGGVLHAPSLTDLAHHAASHFEREWSHEKQAVRRTSWALAAEGGPGGTARSETEGL